MATMLDISSLPSLEKFDSTLLDRLLRANTGEAPLAILDEQQAPDSEAALQRLMAGSQACCPPGQTSSPVPQSLLPQTPHAVVPPTPFAAGCPSPHGQTAAHAAAGAAAPQLPMSFGALGSFPMTQSDIAAAAAAFAMPEALGGGGNGVKRKNRGARMDELIKAEDDGVECAGTSEASLTNDSSQAPSNKRRRNAGRDDTARSGMTITAPMDETDSRARVRREKNRIAARKCRAKKVQFMADLQLTLRELMHKNEEYKLQVVTWHKMFSREVRLREAMKRIIAAIWQNGANPAAVTGCTANDVIIGLESGTLDVNTIVRALTAAPATTSGGPAPTATAPTLATAGQEPSVGAPSIAGSSPQDASPLSGAGASFSAPAGKMAAAAAAGQLLPMQLSNVSDATGQLQATASEVFSGANGSAFAAMAAMPCAQ